jgi:hypothetical protein
VTAANLRGRLPTPSNHWHFDEIVIVIRGHRYWLWHAVDNEGEVLNFLVQSLRDTKAAVKLMRKLLKRQGVAPSRIVTDKLRGSEPTTGRRTRISLSQGGSARCSASNHLVAHSASCLSMLPLAIRSTTSITY